MIGICIGDPAGIGAEVALKAVAKLLPEDDESYLFIGDSALLEGLNRSLGTSLDFKGPRIKITNPLQTTFSTPPKPHSTEAGEAAFAWLQEAGKLALERGISAMVTAPLSKEGVIRTGRKFVGQTEFLSELAGTKRTAMMLMGHDERQRWLRVALVTTHLPIKEVAQAITAEKVKLAIELCDEAGKLLQLPRRKIAVCGLNPHAGEGGEIGREEIESITPAVAECHAKGFDVEGPLAADTLFHYALRGDYDFQVAMYHDQGLGPLKMIGFENGINWTLGLPFVRTSPDHGTAFNIAGKGIANPESMIAALNLAKKLSKR